MSPQTPLNGSDPLPNERPTIPLLVRISGVLWMVTAVLLLLGFIKGWTQEPGIEYVAQRMPVPFIVFMILAVGWGLLRGKRYAVFCLAVGTLGALTPIIAVVRKDGLTWWSLVMLVAVVVLGVMPFIAALRSWGSFKS